MSKFLIRLTIIAVAVYLIVCYLVTAIFQVNIWRQIYYPLFELCVCLCISKQGIYHCKFVKWTAYAIFVQDTIVSFDVLFDFLPNGLAAIIPPTILTAGLVTTTVLAIRHFIKVKRLKKIWKV